VRNDILDGMFGRILDGTMGRGGKKVWYAGGILLFVDFLEDVFETAVVAFEDGVLGGHVQRPTPLEGELETAVCESGDGFVGVVHGKTYSSGLQLEVFINMKRDKINKRGQKR